MKLVGPVGESFFDIWTICHVASWLWFGYFVASQDWSFWGGLLYVGLPVAYAWELVETGVERGIFPGKVKRPEAAINRWISDPLFAMPYGYTMGFLIVAGYG